MNYRLTREKRQELAHVFFEDALDRIEQALRKADSSCLVNAERLAINVDIRYADKSLSIEEARLVFDIPSELEEIREVVKHEWLNIDEIYVEDLYDHTLLVVLKDDSNDHCVGNVDAIDESDNSVHIGGHGWMWLEYAKFMVLK